ncbi:amidohydrolase [Spirosoma terrae]|uniref:Amidohydrolase family protein n=1 Tax=Spirosoma terrae TaxID=1968276 RepID=A0A6L9L7E3_9BACT|nr:amidohydrolase family protein [Spirosoma terrae]NDU96535.1 amidohydrolase family protein [Spirosoma terrae]
MRYVLTAFFIHLFSLGGIAQQPDLILTNGQIFTSDTSQLYVEALAIKGGRIIAIGKSSDIEKLATRQTKRLDLGGMLVVPGFNDAHNHLPGGLKATKLALTGMDPSWIAIQDSLKKAVERTPEGQWIEGTLGITVANSLEATRFVLDKIAPKHPVRLLSWWGHVGLYNTLGLREMGIAENQPDPKGGFYERMPDGKTLTGKGYEKNAYWPNTSYAKMAVLRDENAMVAEFKGMTQALLKAGITSYQNMCTGATATDYARVWQKAGLPFRLRLIRWGDMNPDGSLSIPAKDQPKTTPDLPLLTVSGTKWLLEGTPLEGGAEQVDPYPNRPGWYGRMNYTIPEIERMCREAVARKDQLHFHIGGSKSMGKLLDLMSAMPVDWKALRPRFEHGDEIDYLPEYIKKAQAMGIIIVQNPTHFAPIDGFPMGPPATHGMAMKTLLNDHIPLAIGSDGPFNPYLNIMFATTHPRRPSEAISREQAVIAYTRTAAYAEFAETTKGTLTVGKVADLAVLSQNIFKVPVPKLLQTESILTMVNGAVVYDAGLLKVN